MSGRPLISVVMMPTGSTNWSVEVVNTSEREAS